MKASIILSACFVVISADSLVGNNHQQSSASSVATRKSNTFKVWQAPNVYSRYFYFNPGILSKPGSDIRLDYNWWYSPYSSVQWGVQHQWQPNYDQQRFVNTIYGPSSASHSATNSLDFQIYGHPLPPASYMLKRLEERLMSYGDQSSYRYESYWDSIVAQFIEHYVNDHPGFKIILKEQNKTKIFSNFKDIITSMVKYLKQHWDILWLNNNQKEDLIAQLESNMVAPDIINFLNRSTATAELKSKKQSSKEVIEQRNYNLKQDKFSEEKHSQSMLKMLNADNNQNEILPKIPPFQIPFKFPPQMSSKDDKLKEDSVDNFKTDKEKSQQESSSQRMTKERKNSMPSVIRTVRPPTHEMELVNGVPAKGFPYSSLRTVPLPQIDEPFINGKELENPQSFPYFPLRPVPLPQIDEPSIVYGKELENGYHPYQPLKPVPVPQIIEPPSQDLKLENGYHPKGFPYPPLKRQIIAPSIQGKDLENGYHSEDFPYPPSRLVPLPQIVEPPTYEMGLENGYRLKGFSSTPIDPFPLPETIQPTPYDMGLNHRPQIFPYPSQPVKPSYPDWIYGDKLDDNKITIPILTKPNKHNCDKLAEIFKDITNILSNKSLDEERDNLKLLFKIIKIFIAHNRLDNEPFGVAVDEIGRRLFKYRPIRDNDNRELETGQKLLETEFQSGDISRLLQDVRNGRANDILVFINKLKRSIEQLKRTLITRKFSQQSLKVLLGRAVSMATKAGEHFLDECKSKNAKLISSSLSLALNLNPEDVVPIPPF